MINIIVWLIVGALCGWVGFMATRTEDSFKGIGMNITLGMAGALLGGVSASSLVEAGASIDASVIGTFGAVTASVLIIMIATVMDFFGKARSS